ASPFFPRLEFTTAHAYLQHIKAQLEREQSSRTVGAGFADKPVGESITSQQNPPASAVYESMSPSLASIPVWDDELYLEFHRGCYTTHADQKFWNRRCEGLLYQAELFASLATLSTGADYPQTELEEAWKKVLFNQFHDILPGTSIPEVFVEANTAWQEVEQVGLKIVEQSLRAIASQIALPPPPQPNAHPIIVFNPLNWKRSELIAVSLEETGDWGQQQVNSQNSHPQSSAKSTEASWEIYDFSGQKLPCQLTEESTLLFLARDIPSVGYRVFWLCPVPIPNSPFPIPNSSDDFVLENEWLRVVVDPDTGDLSSVFDKIHQREVLSDAGNQLQAFQDSGQYWDAWNIDPNYAQHPLPSTELKSIEWIERGELRSRLRVMRQLGQSQFCQDYILDTESPLLKIATTVDWQERHVLVKAAFPLNLDASYATYEIPCGAIDRPTRPQTPSEQAKWEVPALHWADIGDTEYGVSLVNDCKYGYDAQPSQLRLTLLRSPCWPDSEADQGIHQFTYALYPHSGSWQSAGTVQRGYELNMPLIVLNNCPFGTYSHRHLQPMGRLLDLQAPNLVLMAFKQSEDTPNQWIMRCYECKGESAELSLTSDLDLAIAHPVDLLERSIPADEVLLNGQSVNISPWKIATLIVRVTSNHPIG
ncbi:alpha-mannosidase, partial [Allocoleopsis sp.]|uniref:alpha-mannosidase n=1 Tax=Allocoleopsis sp. TaxID=3088169 RepID=UPI002FCFC71B